MNRVRPFLGAALMMLAGCSGTVTTTTATTTTAADVPTTTPSTAVTTTTIAIELVAYVEGEDVDFDAIAEAYRVVFDSETSYQHKARHLVDASGLEDVVARYQATGADFGGVTARVIKVGTAGDRGEVLYTLYFNDNPAYGGLEGDIVRVDGEWKVTRWMFCDIMDHARVGC